MPRETDEKRPQNSQAGGAPLPCCDTPSTMAVPGAPIDVPQRINKYGTYQTQDTTDTDNVFPMIGAAAPPGGKCRQKKPEK